MNKTYENFEEWLKEHDEQIRADERRKVLHEQRALDVNLQISAEELRADARTKTIDEFVKSLFANEVIDKSVVRRVSEQLKERK